MPELLRYGTYVPAPRAPLREIQSFYGRPGRPRARALATPALDEDPLTMAFEAARSALAGEREVGAVLLVTQAPPFGLRKMSATLARALRLADDALHVDLGQHAGGLLDAFALAGAVTGDGARPALVVATDHLVSHGDRVCDMLSAGGAAAFVLGGSGGFAALGPQARASQEVYDVWRLHTEREPRYRLEVLFDAYAATTRRALAGLAAATERPTAEYAAVCPSQPHPQTVRGLGRAGVQPGQLEHTTFVGEIGNLGAASVGLALALALDRAEPGQHLVALGYGGGEAVAQEIAVRGAPPRSDAAAMVAGGEPISLSTYYRWTQGRTAEPH